MNFFLAYLSTTCSTLHSSFVPSTYVSPCDARKWRLASAVVSSAISLAADQLFGCSLPRLACVSSAFSSSRDSADSAGFVVVGEISMVLVPPKCGSWNGCMLISCAGAAGGELLLLVESLVVVRVVLRCAPVKRGLAARVPL